MSAEQENRELYSLLIPLSEERLLVPRMCVAEVISFVETDGADGDAPEWYLGTLDWNGRRLPVLTFDGTRAEDAPVKKRGRTRVVVFHSVTGKVKGGYYGILTQGFPQLVRVNPDVLSLDTDRPITDDQPALCRVRMIHEFPLIPDVERLEGMLADLQERSRQMQPAAEHAE